MCSEIGGCLSVKEKAHKHKQIFPVTARVGGGSPDRVARGDVCPDSQQNLHRNSQGLPLGLTEVWVLVPDHGVPITRVQDSLFKVSMLTPGRSRPRPQSGHHFNLADV